MQTVLLFVATTALAEPPQVPEPPQAPPVVIQRVTTGEITYAEAHARVLRGETVLVFVGIPPDKPKGLFARINELPGLAPGKYAATRWADGEPRMEIISTTTITSSVRVEVPASTFRRSEPMYDPDHVCDRCGTWVGIQSGGLPGGRHTHTCPRCGNVWYH